MITEDGTLDRSVLLPPVGEQLLWPPLQLDGSIGGRNGLETDKFVPGHFLPACNVSCACFDGTFDGLETTRAESINRTTCFSWAK